MAAHFYHDRTGIKTAVVVVFVIVIIFSRYIFVTNPDHVVKTKWNHDLCPSIYETEKTFKQLVPDTIIIKNVSLNEYDVIDPKSVYQPIVQWKDILKSVLSMGHQQHKIYKRLKQKLILKKEKLRILAIGGSITCGHSMSNEEKSPKSINDTWPRFLGDYLTKYYDHNNITVTNICTAGSGTVHWVQQVGNWKQEPTHEVHFADLIIIDSAVNDVIQAPLQTKDKVSEIIYGKLGDAVTQENEILIRELLAVNRHAAFLWLGASSRTSQPSAAVYSHLNATIPYGIPQIDMMHAFQTWESPERMRWFYVYLTDMWHPTISGNKVIAFYIFSLMNLMMCTKLDFSSKHSVHKLFPNLKLCGNTKSWSCVHRNDPPLYVSKFIAEVYEKGRPCFIDLIKSSEWPQEWSAEMTSNEGFSIYEDVHSKPGFIGNVTDSHFELLFNSDIVKTHVTFGILKIAYLETYTSNAGKFLVQIHANSTEQLANKTIDCMNPNNGRVSITTITQVNFNKTLPGGTTLTVRIQIIPSATATVSRTIDKVKLLGISIY